MKKQLTQEELEQVRNFESDFKKLLMELGSVDLQIKDIEEALSQAKYDKGTILEKIIELRQVEQQIAKNLNDKYGSGVIDINTGEIQEK